MRQENSPFRPALRKPADDSVLAGDPAADNFLAGSDNLGGRVTIDSVSPINQVDTPATTEPEPMATINNIDTTSQPTQPSDDIFEALSQQADTPAEPTITAESEKKPAKSSKKLHMPKFGKHKTQDTNATKSAISVAADVADNATPALTAPVVETGKKTTTKPTKQVTISALTIIFFVLFIASTACAVYFGIQNSSNANKLSDAQAQVDELTAKSSENANSTTKQNNNFDALQDKITTLTKESSDKQKTIDQLNKDKTDLNNKVNTLNGQVTTLQNKVNSDSQTSTDVKSLITTLCTKDDFKSSSACVAASSTSNQSSNQSNSNQQSQSATPAPQPNI